MDTGRVGVASFERYQQVDLDCVHRAVVAMVCFKTWCKMW